MKRAICLLAVLSVAAPAAAATRVALGQFGRWGAFRETPPPRCFAMARATGAVLSVSTWPSAGVRYLVEAQFDAPAVSAALTVGARPPVALTVRDRAAWAADRQASDRLVTALRSGDRIMLTMRFADGRRRRARFPAAGLPSAVDAALVGCGGR